MTRNHALDAFIPTVIAVALAWLGTAYALDSDPSGIDGPVYLVVAFAAALLVVLACVRCWHIGALAGVGATTGLWRGAAEAVDRMSGYGGGWMGGFDYVVYVVPLMVAFVALVAVVTCAAAGTCPSPSRQPASPAPGQP